MTEQSNVADLLARLQEHVPFLKDMIINLKTDMPQHGKIVALHNMITDKKRKFKFDTLIKCEEVILKMKAKTNYKALPKSPKDDENYTIDSPDPEITDSIEKQFHAGDRYLQDAPSVYSSAAESIGKPSTKSVFERLGAIVPEPDTSKPPISVADLELLRCDVVDEPVANPVVVEEKVVAKKESKISLVPAPIIKPRPKTDKTEVKSPKVDKKIKLPNPEKWDKDKEKSKVEKIVKDAADSIFGNLLSSIDEKILVQKRRDSKEGVGDKRKDSKEGVGDKRKDSKEAVKQIKDGKESDKPKDTQLIKKDNKAPISSKPPEKVYKRLADKYNPKPRKPATNVERSLKPEDLVIPLNLFSKPLELELEIPLQPIKKPPVTPPKKSEETKIPFILSPERNFDNVPKIDPRLQPKTNSFAKAPSEGFLSQNGFSPHVWESPVHYPSQSPSYNIPPSPIYSNPIANPPTDNRNMFPVNQQFQNRPNNPNVRAPNMNFQQNHNFQRMPNHRMNMRGPRPNMQNFSRPNFNQFNMPHQNRMHDPRINQPPARHFSPFEPLNSESESKNEYYAPPGSQTPNPYSGGNHFQPYNNRFQQNFQRNQYNQFNRDMDTPSTYKSWREERESRDPRIARRDEFQRGRTRDSIESNKDESEKLPGEAQHRDDDNQKDNWNSPTSISRGAREKSVPRETMTTDECDKPVSRESVARDEPVASEERGKSREGRGRSVAREEREKSVAREERGKSVSREERGRSVAREERGKSVAREERGKSVSREERGKSVAREERGKSVAREERGKSVAREERGKSVSREGRGRSVAREERGKSVSREERGKSVAREERGKSVAREERGKSVSREGRGRSVAREERCKSVSGEGRERSTSKEKSDISSPRDKRSRSSSRETRARSRQRAKSVSAHKSRSSKSRRDGHRRRRSSERKRSRGDSRKSRYDQMYSNLSSEQDDSIQSPLDNLYTSKKEVVLQTFKIPKKPKAEETVTSNEDEVVEEKSETEMKVTSSDDPPILSSDQVSSTAVEEAKVEDETPKVEKLESNLKAIAEAPTDQLAELNSGLPPNVKEEFRKWISNIKEHVGTPLPLLDMFGMLVDCIQPSTEPALKAKEEASSEVPSSSAEVDSSMNKTEIEETEEDQDQDSSDQPLSTKIKSKKTKKFKKVAKKSISKKKYEPDETDEDEKLVESVGERIKNRKRNTPTVPPAKKQRKNELDKLHEDIKETMGDGVLAVPLKRACTMQKELEDEKLTVDDSILEKVKDVKVVLLKLPDRKAKRKVETEVSTSPLPKRKSMTRAAKAIASYADEEEEELPKKPCSEEEDADVDVETMFNEEKIPEPSPPAPTPPPPTPPPPPPLPEAKEEEVVPPKILRKRRKSTAGLAKTDAKKKKLQESNDEEREESVKEDESREEICYVEPDKNYYLTKDAGVEYKCKVCDFSGFAIVEHYMQHHPKMDCLISRLSPEETEQAIKEAELEKLDDADIAEMKTKHYFKCRFCLQEFDEVGSLYFYNHLTSHTCEFRFKCGICHYKSNGRKDLRMHYSEMHETEATYTQLTADFSPASVKVVCGYVCSECNFLQLNKLTVDEHIQIYHLDDTACVKKINMSLKHGKKPKPLPKPKKAKKPTAAKAPAALEVLRTPEKLEVSKTPADLNISTSELAKELLKIPVEHELPKTSKKVTKKAKVAETTAEAENGNSAKELDISVFMCATDIEDEAASVKVSRLEKMKEINESVTPRRTSMVNKLKDRFDLDNSKKVEVAAEMKGSSLVKIKKENNDPPPEQGEQSMDIEPINKAIDIKASVESNDDRVGIITESPEDEISESTPTVPTEPPPLSKTAAVFPEMKIRLRDDLLKPHIKLRETLSKLTETSKTPDDTPLSVLQIEELTDSSSCTTPIASSSCTTPVASSSDTRLDSADSSTNTPQVSTASSTNTRLDSTANSSNTRLDSTASSTNTRLDSAASSTNTRQVSTASSTNTRLLDSTDKRPDSTPAKKCLMPKLSKMVAPIPSEPENIEKVFSAAGVNVIISKNKEQKYECRKPSCIFTTDIRKVFENHCSLTHKNEKLPVSCDSCDVKSVLSRMEIFQHVCQHVDLELFDPVAVPEVVPTESIVISDDEESPRFTFKITQVTSLAPKKPASPTREKPLVLNGLPPLVPLTDNGLGQIKITDVVSLNMQPAAEEQEQPRLVMFQTLAPVPALKPTASGNEPKILTCRVVPLSEDEIALTKKSTNVLNKWLMQGEWGKLFKCPSYTCGFTANAEDTFSLHISTHKFDSLVPCLYCNYKMKIEYYAIHLVVRHKSSKHGCPYCLYRAVSKDYVKYHLQEMHDGSDYKVLHFKEEITFGRYRCPALKSMKDYMKPYLCKCNKKYYAKENFTKHLKNCPENKARFIFWNIFEYNCRYCSFSEPTTNNFLKHMAKHHPFHPVCIITRHLKDPNAVQVDEDDTIFDKLREITKLTGDNSESDIIEVPVSTEPEQIEEVNAPPEVSSTKDEFDESTEMSPEDVDDTPVKTKGLSGTDLFRCAICKEGYPDSITFKSHLHECMDGDPKYAKPVCFHCDKTLKGPSNLVEHIRIHGTVRIGCSLCPYKNTHQWHLRAHMKMKHKIIHCKFVPTDPKKTNIDSDEFMVRPFFNRRSSTIEAQASKDQAVTTTSDSPIIYSFGPDNIHMLPIKSIFNYNVSCNICNFQTKVRMNLLRHMSQHEKGKEIAIPITAPVNPVPCLEKNELMFDKMTNLASSSHAGGRMGGKTVTEEPINYPVFVPLNKRYVCGAKYCNYLCLGESMLRHHLQALHTHESNYTCAHCNVDLVSENANVNVDGVLNHLRLHDNCLYKCFFCNYLNNNKVKVEKHCTDKHPDKTLRLVVLRENMQQDALGESKDGKDSREGKKKPWKCAMCKGRFYTKADVMSHAESKHAIDSQYKCSCCDFKTFDKDSFGAHFETTHNGMTVDYIVVYYSDENEAAKVEEPREAFDTTPLWMKNKTNQIKHIRGILLEEQPKQAKKSPAKLTPIPIAPERNESKPPVLERKLSVPAEKKPPAEKNSTAEKKPPTTEKQPPVVEKNPPVNQETPPSKPPVSNLDLAIEAVANGTATILLSSLGPGKKKLNKAKRATAASEPNWKNQDPPLSELRNMPIDKLKSMNFMSVYGPLGKPYKNKYLCPLCASFKTKEVNAFETHLCQELQYYKYGCRFCSHNDVTLTGVQEHILQKHTQELPKQCNMDFFKCLPAKKPIEKWIFKVRAYQDRLIKDYNDRGTSSRETSTTVSSLPEVVIPIISCDDSPTFDDPQEDPLEIATPAEDEGPEDPSKLLVEMKRVSADCEENRDEKFTSFLKASKPYSCSKCDYSGQYNQLQKHIETHPGNDAYIRDCSGNALKSGTYSCFYCSLESIHRQYLIQHHKWRHRDKELAIVRCDEPENLMKLPSSIERLKCAHCEATYKDLTPLKEHYYTHHQNDDFRFIEFGGGAKVKETARKSTAGIQNRANSSHYGKKPDITDEECRRVTTTLEIMNNYVTMNVAQLSKLLNIFPRVEIVDYDKENTPS